MNSVIIYVPVVSLCRLLPSAKTNRRWAAELFIIYAALTAPRPPYTHRPPRCLFILKDNKEFSFSHKLNINQDCLSFISYASERKCDTGAT